ncbi:hypothetical protein [Acrocarpospora catenulata]|uniref:hypothetical protein n=1 Tax=Acrocarpospora catenulata TaxID=2836182 RepID=UPI001BDA77F8|nr:hypothetical protein [Acrocarpospora catenulata]
MITPDGPAPARRQLSDRATKRLGDAILAVASLFAACFVGGLIYIITIMGVASCPDTCRPSGLVVWLIAAVFPAAACIPTFKSRLIATFIVNALITVCFVWIGLAIMYSF